MPRTMADILTRRRVTLVKRGDDLEAWVVGDDSDCETNIA